MVGDRGGLAKAIFAEMSNVYGVNIEAAEKTAKRDYIELLNGDLIDGRIKIRRGSLLEEEWSYLVWDEHHQHEDKSCKNHVADSFLYQWRYSYHYLGRSKSIAPAHGTAAYWAEQMIKDRDRAIAAKKRRESQNWFQELASDQNVLNELAYNEDPWDFNL